MASSRQNKSETVIVHVRLRPFNSDESKKKHKSAVNVFDTESKSIVLKKGEGEK